MLTGRCGGVDAGRFLAWPIRPLLCVPAAPTGALPMLAIPPDFQNPDFAIGNSHAVDLAHAGQGNWRAFRALGLSLPEVMEIARGWGRAFAGIDRPWLCWHVDPEWSLVQQRLVASVGWTPVVGFDPRAGAPRHAIRQAVVIDFNRDLGLPVLYPHFPLEFMFLFGRRLAFWHSDLLLREEVMRTAAAHFARLQDGETTAVKGWAGWRAMLTTRRRRYWELLGCTTAGASRDQFEKGCGWWMSYAAHPNQTDGARIRRRYYWDHGAGIYYWHRARGGRFRLLDDRRYDEGHFTKIGNPEYRRYREPGSNSDARRLMSAEIRENFDLVRACRALGLESVLQASD